MLSFISSESGPAGSVKEKTALMHEVPTGQLTAKFASKVMPATRSASINNVPLILRIEFIIVLIIY